jgi:hypothetical protein
MVIDPAETRRVLCETLTGLTCKRDEQPRRKHGNTPL